MKWREPWKASIRQSWSLSGSLRRIGRGFLVWLGVFAALVVVHGLIGPVAFEDLPSRIAGTSAFAAAMALTLHLVWLLSPRRIESGPRGIVVIKSDELRLLPWSAIASFHISRTVLPGVLTLELHSGETCRLVLAHDASAGEISREINERIGSHTQR